jgi:hypothetical protein
MIFNRDGTLSRERKMACKQCGSTHVCDDCWEHVSDWSPFGIWTCLLCRMSQAIYDADGAGVHPVRCEACGWDEAVECGHIEFDNDEDGKLVAYEVKYDPETREVVSRTRQVKYDG